MATYSTATSVHSFIIGVPTRWESNKFVKIRNLFRAVMYPDVDWCYTLIFCTSKFLARVNFAFVLKIKYVIKVVWHSARNGFNYTELKKINNTSQDLILYDKTIYWRIRWFNNTNA